MVSEDFQGSTNSPDPANYVPPVKAAGDVSLDGRRLAEFLVKATLRLPAVSCYLKYCLQLERLKSVLLFFDVESRSCFLFIII